MLNHISLKTWKTFFKLLLPNTKPIVAGTIFHPPNQTNLLEIFYENLPKADTNNVETYILRDFNINLFFPKTRFTFMSFSPE